MTIQRIIQKKFKIVLVISVNKNPFIVESENIFYQEKGEYC